jgi:methyl-accepting chemotaxis protein
MAAILASFGVILVLFISRFVVPLNAITAAVRSMADGDLTVSAPETLPDDMRPLGQGLNDLAANFQEVLLFTGATTGNLRNELEALEARLSQEDAQVDTEELKAGLSELRLELETLSAMVEQFKYYQADFNGKEVKPQ